MLPFTEIGQLLSFLISFAFETFKMYQTGCVLVFLLFLKKIWCGVLGFFWTDFQLIKGLRL